MKNTRPDTKIAAVRVRCAMTEQERDIINVLTPAERLAVLLEAGKKKMERLLSETEQKKEETL